MLEEKMKQLQLKESSSSEVGNSINVAMNTPTNANNTSNVTVKKISGSGEKPLDSAIMKFAQ